MIITAITLFIIFMRLHSQHRKPAKAAIANMVLGVSALILIAPLTSVAINVYTVFTVLTLGVPGALLITLAGVLV
jgi:amino acid transporter